MYAFKDMQGHVGTYVHTHNCMLMYSMTLYVCDRVWLITCTYCTYVCKHVDMYIDIYCTCHCTFVDICT